VQEVEIYVFGTTISDLQFDDLLWNKLNTKWSWVIRIIKVFISQLRDCSLMMNLIWLNVVINYFSYMRIREICLGHDIFIGVFFLGDNALNTWVGSVQKCRASLSNLRDLRTKKPSISFQTKVYKKTLKHQEIHPKFQSNFHNNTKRTQRLFIISPQYYKNVTID
jgi:hypothetical protein